MCAAEAGIFVYLVRRRFGGGGTCAFRRFDNVGGGIRFRHGDNSSKWLTTHPGISVAPSGRFPFVRDRPIGIILLLLLLLLLFLLLLLLLVL